VKPPLYGRILDKSLRLALAQQVLVHLGLEQLENLNFEP
jgi:hypothetical protein